MVSGPAGEVARRLARRFAGTYMEDLGITLREMGGGRAVVELPIQDRFKQLTGVLHAGVLVALADTAATAASLSLLYPSGEMDPSTFPYMVQMSTYLMANTTSGTLVAQAEALHRGRTTHVVQVRVSDGTGRLLALMTGTLLIVTRPAERGQ